jgi:dTDP-4-dehydrorhamnose reductase
VGAWLLHISTADVFGGPGSAPREVDETPRPVSAYGRTRLAGEQAVREIHPDGSWVVRTGWVYGPSPQDVVGAAAAGARGDGEVVAFDDRFGSPTWAGDLGPALVALALSDVDPGVLHVASPGTASFHDLTREAYAVLGADPGRVRAVAAPATGAPRPSHAVLSTGSWDAAGLPPLPGWREGLRRALGG